MRKVNPYTIRKIRRLCLSVGAAIAIPVAVSVFVRNIGSFGSVISEAAELAENAEIYAVTASSLGNGEVILYQTEAPVSTAEPISSAVTTKAEVVQLPRLADEPMLLLSQNISELSEDLSLFNRFSGKIVKTTIQASGGADFHDLAGGGQVRNCTDIDNSEVDSRILEECGIHIETDTAAPQVLIIHTHTMESYEYTERDFFDSEYKCRTADSEKSVVAVGKVIAEQIAAAGISVIHDGTIHDELYSGAYERSSKTVEAILKEYPSIKVVLDIHRDALLESDGTRIAPVAEINGKTAAQVMIISAADDGTYDNPHFWENFNFACLLQQQFESDWNGITRPVLFQYCQYNQQLSEGALLIEVGSHANSLEQALYSGELIGKSIAEALISNR